MNERFYTSPDGPMSATFTPLPDIVPENFVPDNEGDFIAPPPARLGTVRGVPARAWYDSERRITCLEIGCDFAQDICLFDVYFKYL